jgi:hypothetical protein
MENFSDRYDTKMAKPIKASLVAIKIKFQDGCK